MNTVAFALGGVLVYWSALIVCLGIAAWFFLSLSLYRSDGGPEGVLWLLFPLALLLSLFFARLLHWYCHAEQYAGLLAALTDHRSGGYCLPGVLAGLALAAAIPVWLRLAPSYARLMDALAPGTALGLSLIRLSALFTNADRGKLLITQAARQHLPLAAPVSTGSGAVEYRFATFFWEFMLLLALALALLHFFLRYRRVPMRQGKARGSVALRFLLYFAALELLADSSRYDSSFLPINGFVSLTQLVCALLLLFVLVYYSRRSILADGLQGRHWLLWAMFLAGLLLAGGAEYLVQRHGDWLLRCYSLMALGALLMVLPSKRLYKSLRRRKKPARS